MDPVVAVKNLSSLRNIDPCAEAILDKATHTALYRFNNNAKSWEKTDVDGAMFIYRRVDVPFYSLMIANRQSPQDMIEPIVPTIRLKIHQPYLFFCKPDGEIRGLWFCEDAECERIYRVIDGILTTLRNENTKIDAGQGVPVAPPASSVPAPADLPVVSATSVLSTPCINDGTVSALCGTDKPPTPSNERSSILDMLSAAQNRANTNKKVSDGVVGTTPIDNYRPSSEASQGPFVQIMQKLLDTSQTVGSKPLSTPSPLPTAAESVRADELERSFLSNTIPVESVPNTQSAPLLPLRVLRGPTAIHESASGTSLRACSTLSVHGSDDHDPSELGSVRADAEDSVIQPGESATEPPLMDKAQFVSAISHLLATDEGFVRQLHQAYVDALMRRFRLD